MHQISSLVDLTADIKSHICIHMTVNADIPSKRMLKANGWIKYDFLLLDTLVSFLLTKQQNTTLYIA
jgi:hypothetical protein